MKTPDFRHEAAVPRRPHHIAPDLSSARVVHVLHRWQVPAVGTSDHGLGVTIDGTVKTLRDHGVQAEAWSVRSTNQLSNRGAEELTARLEADSWKARRPVTHVIVNTPSFLWPAAFVDLARTFADIEFVQLNHSGLSYLHIDKFGIRHIRALHDLMMSHHNIKIAGNNPRFVQWCADAYGIESLYLPNLYDVSSFRGPTKTRRDFDPLRIGSFGAGRDHKNQGTAALAAIALARRLGVQLELYVNKSRIDSSPRVAESRGELFEGVPGGKLITVPWDNWTRFRRTVGEMDLLFCPSFDETFCMICADGIAEGVPSVVGPALEWTPRSWHCEPHDPASIARVGVGLLHDRNHSVHDGRVLLTRFVEAGVRQWIHYLTQGVGTWQ